MKVARTLDSVVFVHSMAINNLIVYNL